MIEQAIQMALLHGRIYFKMQKVFSTFEEGGLKDQRSRKMEGVTLQKALEGKLAPKLQHFKIFQGLEVIICAPPFTVTLIFVTCNSSKPSFMYRTFNHAK